MSITSTFLFNVQFLGKSQDGTVQKKVDDWWDQDMQQKDNKIKQSYTSSQALDYSLFGIFNSMIRYAIYVVFNHGDHLLEFICLVHGWIFIFNRPGLAVLRCFRLFRVLW